MSGEHQGLQRKSNCLQGGALAQAAQLCRSLAAERRYDLIQVKRHTAHLWLI